MKYPIASIFEIYSGAMLCVLLFKIRNERNTPHKMIFTSIALSTTILLFSDSINWMVDGHPQEFLHAVNSIVVAIYYFLHFVVLSLWILYVWTVVHRDKRIPNRLYYILGAISAAFLLLIVSNAWNGELYSIDENNTYHRGALFLPFAASCFLFLSFALFLTVLNRRSLTREVFATLMLFPVLPIVGAATQAIFYGLPLIWTFSAFAILVVYINIQNDLIVVDHLTGTYNRTQIESLIKQRLKQRNSSFGLIMIDLDHFKEINDTYGHVEGDSALEEVPVILREAIRPSDVVSRIGGDEFLVLLNTGSEGGLSEIVERIKKSVTRRNDATLKAYDLSFSMGASIFQAVNYGSVTEVVAEVDKLMYRHKRGLV